MFVALNKKHMHFYSHMSVDQSNSWPQMSAYSIQPKVFFQAYHNVSVKKPEVFEKCLKSACDDHFSKMQDTARNDHLKKKSLGFVCRNNFFAVDIAKHDSTAFN